MSIATKPEVKTVRCAIYTRKSTEEGLDQEFNSLDAQRESAENYIASQQQEGWVVIPKHYDDGGFSGGNLERPAMNRLLADISNGEVDCVVVYKVDRLSRSLLDFSQIMGAFDRQGVWFVSVTQAFNTTHSMGRLTLNILLSFAQFEREIIGERIRDKIAAQRRRGKWAGGIPVLGYDVDRSGPSPKLVINADEAARVRRIFGLYLELQSLTPVVEELERRGWTLKEWRTKSGKPKGGRLFDKSSLHSLLTNQLYIGRIKHKAECYQGEHPAVVDEKLFDDVGAMLRSHARSGGAHLNNKYHSLLRGLLYCPACNRSMVHNVSKRGVKVYRYYTCLTVIKRGRKHCSSPSLPAAVIESAVVGQVRSIAGDSGLRRSVLEQALEQVGNELSELQTQRSQLQTQLKRAEEQIQDIVVRKDLNGSKRLVDLHEQVERSRRSLARVDLEIQQLQEEQIDERDVNAAFSDFDNIWNALNTAERSELLSLLVSRIEFDADDSSLSIEMHPAGIKSLANQVEEPDA
jgi:site-specific DNA recombinase